MSRSSPASEFANEHWASGQVENAEKTSESLDTDVQNVNGHNDISEEPLNNSEEDIKKKLENERLWSPMDKKETISPAWAFGYNHSVPLINLSNDQSSVVFFASAHLLVLYDFKSERQRILRGHCNEITSIACSGDKRWLASGDRGIDSVVIIWDGKTGEAVRTMLKPHKNGVVSIALTKDARYLATLSADPSDQSFAIWNWTTGSDLPHCQAKISGENSFQTKITFNPDDYYHLCTNGDQQVIFYNWKSKEKDVVVYAPSLNDEDFRQKIGQFSYTQYIPEKYSAITATSTGLLVVWEADREPVKGDNSETPYKRATKVIPLHDKAITFLTITTCYPAGKCIVTGDSSGQVKFFDCNFMLLFWYQDIKCGPINSVSFATTSLFDDFTTFIKQKDYPTCATIDGEAFVVENFIVNTSNAVMISVTVEGGFKKLLLRDHDSDVNGISAHPILNHVAACSHSGNLKIYDYETKLLIKLKSFGSDNSIETCAYDKSGQYIAVGFVSGLLLMLDALTLNEVTNGTFDYGKGPITHIDFSYCHAYCAFADSAYTTTLLRTGLREFEDPWCYVARVRAHYRRITDLLFWSLTESRRSRLFTLSEDRTLAEYDVHNAKKHLLPVIARYQIEQLAVPLCLSMLPPYYKEEFFFVSTSTSKMKLYNTATLMCRKTVSSYPQGITYTKVIPLISKSNASNYFMVCISKERLGLTMLPLDGDPLKSTNIIAHPSDGRGIGNSLALAIDRNGEYAFTAGGPDTCVHMWRLKPSVLEEIVAKAGCMKERFYAFLSRDFLDEMKDYFYYSMIRTQGINCLDKRETSLTIPITEIPYVMRAIGFYPTETEIENMINEIKYSKFCDIGEYTTEVDLDTFIQLYWNHRPYQGVLYKDVEAAFNILTKVKVDENGRFASLRNIHKVPRKNKPSVPFEELILSLQSSGEPIGENEMSEYLAILLGIIPEGGRLETQGEIDPKKIQEIIEPHMPEFLDFETFVKCVLRMYFCCKDKQSSISAGDSSVEVPQGQKETLISETQVHEERLSSATQTE
uniref:Cilia- and flagella-associated protein 251 n=2 Tax=Trichobilharzia regenti TaxID=157069 RepID=A0AA85IU25_TRIRE|nr:unnamed protein product [Trichobilharzia regenti]